MRSDSRLVNRIHGMSVGSKVSREITFAYSLMMMMFMRQIMIKSSMRCA